MRKTTRPQYSAPPIFWRERPGAEVASPSSLGAGAVSEAGKGVLYVYGIDRKVDTSMRVGTCFAQQQQNKVRRGQRTKRVSDVLPLTIRTITVLACFGVWRA